jgi:hypothetical protein
MLSIWQGHVVTISFSSTIPVCTPEKDKRPVGPAADTEPIIAPAKNDADFLAIGRTIQGLSGRSHSP